MLCGELKKPKKCDVQVMKTLFPSTSGGRKRSGATFDPSEVAVQERKKKKTKRFKCSKITVIAVDASKGLPKGKYRKQLKKDCEKVIEVKRNYSSQRIKNEIIRAFNFSDYKILNCTPEGKFTIAKNHLPTGDELIE